MISGFSYDTVLPGRGYGDVLLYLPELYIVFHLLII